MSNTGIQMKSGIICYFNTTLLLIFNLTLIILKYLSGLLFIYYLI